MTRPAAAQSNDEVLKAAVAGDDAAYLTYCLRAVPDWESVLGDSLSKRLGIDRPRAAALLREWLDSESETAPSSTDPSIPPRGESRDEILGDLRRDSHSELLRAAVNGDDRAYVLFCARAIPDLARSLSVMCRNRSLSPDLADDFAQETLAKAIAWLRKEPRTKPLPPGWLFKISRNVMIDWWRRNARGRSDLDAARLEDAEPSEPLEEPVPLENPGDVRLKAAFRAMPANDRKLLDLAVVQGKGAAAASRILGLPPEGAETRLKDALRLLKDLLDDRLLQEALASLGESDFQILDQVLLKGLAPTEAAEALGIENKWTAYKRYERALKRLRKELDRLKSEAGVTEPPE